MKPNSVDPDQTAWMGRLISINTVAHAIKEYLWRKGLTLCDFWMAIMLLDSRIPMCLAAI
jgi:hypothetical protein